jgi:hypothetical protein
MKTLIRHPYFQALVGFATLGLCIGSALAQTAATGAPAPAAPAAGASGVALNLEPIFAAIVDIAATGVLTLGGLALHALWKKLGVDTNDVQAGIVDAALNNAVHYGATKAMTLAEKVGWTHPVVQNQIVGEAANYVLAQVPDTLKKLGITQDGVGRLVTARVGKLLGVTMDAQAGTLGALGSTGYVGETPQAAAEPAAAKTPTAPAGISPYVSAQPLAGRAPMPSAAG